MRTGLCKDMFITWIGKNETEINSGSPFIPSNPSKYKFADSSKKEIHGI